MLLGITYFKSVDDFIEELYLGKTIKIFDNSVVIKDLKFVTGKITLRK